MKTSRLEIAQIIAERSLTVSKSKLAGEIAAFLVDEKRTSELDLILRDVLKFRLDHGIVEATLVTAHDVDAEIVSQAEDLIKDYFPNAKQYSMDSVIDRKLVGGARILVAGQQIDYSLKSKISKLKQLTTA